MDTTYLLVTDLEVDTALADLTVPAAVRAVWLLLRESEVRLDEVLALDVPDAELDARVVVIHEAKEGGVFEAGVTAVAARVLRELIGARTTGPLFMVDGRRLSRERVAAEFRTASGGRSVHTLRFTRQAKEQGLVRPSSPGVEGQEEKSA